MSDYQTDEPRSTVTIRLGERVKTRRTRLELTQERVAERLRVPRSAVSDIESGKRELSAAEAILLAELFGESLESLLGIEEQRRDTDQLMFRAEAIPATARVQLAQWERQCEIYAQLEREFGERPAVELRPSTAELSSVEQVQRLADEERTRLDLGPTPAHSLLGVLEDRLGIRVFYSDLDDTISGASIASGRLGPAILVNRSHSPGRRVFTLAHELFHLIARGPVVRAGRPPSLHVCDGTTKPRRDLAEQYADRFAGRLLMPPAHFIERLRLMVRTDGSIDPVDLIGVARYFGVSVQAVFVQLGLLGLAPRDLTIDAYRDPAFQEDLMRAGEGNGPIPQRFARLAVKAYRGERISRGKLAELLDVDVGDLDAVLQRYGAGGSDHGIAVTLPD